MATMLEKDLRELVLALALFLAGLGYAVMGLPANVVVGCVIWGIAWIFITHLFFYFWLYLFMSVGRKNHSLGGGNISCSAAPTASRSDAVGKGTRTTSACSANNRSSSCNHHPSSKSSSRGTELYRV